MYTCRRCLLVGLLTFMFSMVLMQHFIQELSNPTGVPKLNLTKPVINQNKLKITKRKHIEVNMDFKSRVSNLEAKLKHDENTPEINLMTVSFIRCHNSNISIAEYIDGYNHLYKLLVELGAVFSLVASDAREKVDILLELTKDYKINSHYKTLQSMMNYERKVYRETGNEMFGSRTLLRLHRALKFMLLFLQRLSEINDDEIVADIAYRSYSDSLGNFHSWVLRHAAKIAVYSLSSKRELVYKLFHNTIEPELVSNALISTCRAIKHLYDKVESLYTKYELHDLP